MQLIKKIIIKIVEKLHLIVFGHKMSDQMRKFMVNLSWSFYAGIISTPISIVIGTLAGRFLGPEEFGKYNLVILVSTYVIVVAFFGLDISTIKRIIKTKSKEEQRKALFSSFVFVMSTLSIFTVIGLISLPLINAKNNLPNNFILLVIVFIFISSFKSILDMLVRALEKFKLQATGKIIEISALAILFIVMVKLFKTITYQPYMIIILLSAIISSIYYFSHLKTYFQKFSLSTLKSMLTEGKFFMLSAILGTIFISSDRLLIAKYVNVSTMGIYSAYYAASLGLVYTFSRIITNVLLPASAKLKNKDFTKKIDQLFLKGFIPIFTMVCLSIFVFLKLFGKAYPLRIEYMLLFALVATLYFFLIVYDIIIIDAGRSRYAKYFYISSCVNLITVGYYFVLLKYWSKSITFVLIGFAVNIIISLIIQRLFVKKMREKSKYAIF